MSLTQGYYCVINGYTNFITLSTQRKNDYRWYYSDSGKLSQNTTWAPLFFKKLDLV